MSRTLSTHVAGAVAAPVTEPWHLVQVGALRLTDGPTTLWQGHWWQSLPGLEVAGIRADGSGLTRATLRIPNHGGLGAGLLFAAGGEDTPVTVWQVYGPGPHADTDAEILAEAVLDGGEAEGEWAEIALASADADSREMPRWRVAPPVFNHLPPAGTRIEWAGEVLILEPGS